MGKGGADFYLRWPYLPRFCRRFEAGERGAEMDFFEWASLYELYREVERYVKRLEQVVT